MLYLNPLKSAHGCILSNMKAPAIHHDKVNMRFLIFSCFFLINLFSSYLDSLLSCIPADKRADANKCKLLLF